MKTAEDLFNGIFGKSECFIDYDNSGLEVIKNSMIEFAKMHVEAALKAAAEEAESYYYDAEGYIIDAMIDKTSILDAYSLENIK